MPQFSHTEATPFALEEIFAWHTRKGALTRITPHWAGKITKDTALSVGNRPAGTLTLPGARGLAQLAWESEIIALEPGQAFTDRMVRGPFDTWQHQHDFLETASGTVLRDTLEYSALSPGVRKKLGSANNLLTQLETRTVEKNLHKFFTERTRRLSADLLFQQRYASDPLTVVLAGASGTIGTQVKALLSTGGHTVRTLVRRPAQEPGEFTWDPDRGTVDDAAFDGAHAIIHLGGASINTRFTEKNKKLILDSRIQSTELLARKAAEFSSSGLGTFMCASAIGIYGADRSGEVLTEESAAGKDFLAEVCTAWEAACRSARDAGVRVVNIRTGIVVSALGGMLRLQLPLFLSGTGGWVGSGKNVQSWISLDDIAGIYVHALLTDSVSGALNAVAPTPVTAKKLAKTVGQVLRRPVLLPIPQQAPALLLGSEGNEQLAQADQQVTCAKLVHSGYEFFEPELAGALEHELG